jgi:hypothetical protein
MRAGGEGTEELEALAAAIDPSVDLCELGWRGPPWMARASCVGKPGERRTSGHPEDGGRRRPWRCAHDHHGNHHRPPAASRGRSFRKKPAIVAVAAIATLGATGCQLSDDFVAEWGRTTGGGTSIRRLPGRA